MIRLALLKRKLLNTGALWVSYIKLLPWLLRLNKNSIVIDCGANTGKITFYLSRTGAMIFAFEPDPIAFEILKNRCGDKTNIICINKGVWDKNATIKLYRHNEMQYEVDFTVSSSIIPEKKNITNESPLQIEVIDLIEFIRSLNKKVDLIKMDIEGAEIEILKRMISTDLHILFKTLYVETHQTKIPGHDEKFNEIKRQLQKKGIANIKLNWL